MRLEDVIDWSQVKIPAVSYTAAPQFEEASDSDQTLDALIHQKSRILNTKLEVIASAVNERLRIRKHNLDRISDDKERLAEVFQKITVAANYHLRDQNEKRILYQKTFELEEERRKQDVECWRDVVLLLRDFLTFWDEHEQTKARGAFFSDVA